MAMATLIDFLKTVRTGESTLPLHLVEEARTCSDDRKTACQTATETKGGSTSATNQVYWVSTHHRFYRFRLRVLLFFFISAEPAAHEF